MAPGRSGKFFTTWLLALLLIGLTHCATNQTDQQRKEQAGKIRDEPAKLTERAEPEVEAAGRELGRAADEAAREARAFAEGVRQGWISGGHHLANLNSASERELMELPNVSRSQARKIIRGRPYREPHNLVERHIVLDDEYAKIKDIVTVKKSLPDAARVVPRERSAPSRLRFQL